MTSKLRDLILAAVVVHASINALRSLSYVLSVHAGRIVATLIYFSVFLGAAGLLYRGRKNTPPGELRLLLIAFFAAAPIFALFETLFVMAPGFSRPHHPIEFKLGVTFILSSAAALLFTWLYKRSTKVPGSSAAH